MTNPLVTITVVVLNGEKYIAHCLDAIRKQTYGHTEAIVFDNNSSDRTKHIVREQFPEFRLIENAKNYGMWPGHEQALKHSNGKYVLCVSADVMIDPEFVTRAVALCETDSRIGAVQAKIYQYEFPQLLDGSFRNNTTIDTCGFAMTRERKVINLGHGEPDSSKWDHRTDIFGVEGAVPFFRRETLEACRIEGFIWDPDYFWYGDDLDLAWRMTLFGFRQVFEPSVIAWHDRSTTKDVKNTGFLADHVRRRALRQRIPIKKRRLDWSNTRFSIIKNDYFANILKDLPMIVMREINVQGYAGLFEQGVLLEWGRFLLLLPRMFARRRMVMASAWLDPDRIRNLMLVNVHEPGVMPPSERWWHVLRFVVVVIMLAALAITAFYGLSALVSLR